MFKFTSHRRVALLITAMVTLQHGASALGEYGPVAAAIGYVATMAWLWIEER